MLTGDSDAVDINSTLRSLMNAVVSGLSSDANSLSALGFNSNGNDDSLSTTDTSGLQTALTNDLAGLKSLFTDPTSGLARTMLTYLNTTIGIENVGGGTLNDAEDTLTKDSSDINTQIANIETQVSAYSDSLTTEFVNMETAGASINTQLSFLSKSST